jgi:uncharacterized membrane protein YfcA
MSPWLAVALAVVAGSAVKAVTGMGLPPVALPVLAMFVGVEDAVVIMALPTVVTNGALVTGNWEHRRENPVLGRMVALSAAGGIAGAWLLTNLDERAIAFAMGALVLAYVATRMRRNGAALSIARARRWSTPVAVGGGVLQGATGLSGPLFGSFLHAQALRPPVFVFSIASLFQFSALAQLVTLAALGRYDGHLLALSSLASALALAVVLVVRPFAARVPLRAFDSLVMVVLVGSVAKMLYDAFDG